MQGASNRLREWLHKRRVLIRVLGFQGMDAGFHQQEIEQIALDLAAWARQARKYLIPAIVMLAAVAVGHFLLTSKPIRTVYFVAYALGLGGTGIAAYGFAFHPRGLASARRQGGFMTMPRPPLSDRDFAFYAASLNETFAKYVNSETEAKWHMARVELRRQMALAIGMGLLAFSFLMQMALQFFDP